MKKLLEAKITSKKWIKVFMILLGIGIVLFVMFNYFFDPVGYYTVTMGKETFTSNDYTRSIKVEYLLENKDEFDAVVVGGSKCGLISVEHLNELTGHRYYNFTFELGNFEDYETYIRFLVEDVGVEYVLLHLSSYEAMKYSVRDISDTYDVPARVDGSSLDLIKENWKFLSWNIGTTIIDAFNKVNTEIDLDSGQRLYSAQYLLIEEDPENYNQENVVSDFDKNMKRLFSNIDHSENADDYEHSIESMKKIKQVCNENDVALEVVIGPSFVGELYLYEGDRYYEFLSELVKIHEVWFFGDYNIYNRNPYNFVDAKHYNKSYSDFMIEAIYDKPSDVGIGHVLTLSNIDEYLIERKADFQKLKVEFEAGEIILADKEDKSYIESK